MVEETNIIDNSKGRGNLASLLNREFRKCNRIAIATAYFNIRGFGAIKEGLLEISDDNSNNCNNSSANNSSSDNNSSNTNSSHNCNTHYVYRDLLGPLRALDSFTEQSPETSNARPMTDKPLLLLLGREPNEEIKWEDKILRELEREQEEGEEDSLDYLNLLKECVDYFSSEKREVRIMEGRFFHGKCYIGLNESSIGIDTPASDVDATDDADTITHPAIIRTGIGVVGSSNFTYGGLISNRELNMYTKDVDAVKELYKWFMEQWNNSKDFKERFLSMLKSYVTTYSPYDVIAKALYEQYRDQIDLGLDVEKNRALKNMHTHQIISFLSAKQKLEKYGGVIIADSTGLGKTMVALNIIHEMQREGRRTILIAPKAILDTTWKDEMRRLNVIIHPDDMIGMEYMSHNPENVVSRFSSNNSTSSNSNSSRSNSNGNGILVVVDEAHYFRNPSSNRHRALRELITRTNASLLLLTATPVNTSLMDLYHLFSLYLSDNSTLHIVGDNLKEYFIKQQTRWLNNEEINMDQVLQEFMVRHSRQFAKAVAIAQGKDIHFPVRRLESIEYDLSINYEEIWNILEEMNFYFYDLAIEKLSDRLRMPDGTLIKDVKVYRERLENLKSLIKIIIKIIIFKRLESSIYSCVTTLDRLRIYTSAAIYYAQNYRYFIPPALKDDIFSALEDDELGEGYDTSIIMNEMFERLKRVEEILDDTIRERCRLDEHEVQLFTAKCREDLERFNSLLSILNRENERGDGKYTEFEDKLKEVVNRIKHGQPSNNNNGVIVFTQYYDTAKYLHEKIRASMKDMPVMLISGRESIDRSNSDRSNDTSIIRDFQDHGGILITTDKLAAGQNLQNAQYIINYDFPWNPVILIQRAGRVDRLGSPYQEIFLINVLPSDRNPDNPSSLTHFLSVFEKLSSRLAAINATVGLDASQLGEHAVPKDFSIYAMIAKRDPEVLRLLERKIEQFTNEPLNILAEIMTEQGIDYLKSLPNGIGAYRYGIGRRGLFILFSVERRGEGEEESGEKGERELHWRLKWFESEEEDKADAGRQHKDKGDIGTRKGKDKNKIADESTVRNANEIVDIIIGDRSSKIYNKGEKIDYDRLLRYMIDMKNELINELRKRSEMERTTAEVPSTTTKTIQNIFDILASEEEDLAVMFRKNSNRINIVSILERALKKGGKDELIKRAREILSSNHTSDTDSSIAVNGINDNRYRIKRLCWCYLE